MNDYHEFVGINPKTSENHIPHAWEETTFTPADLPDASVIKEEVFYEAERVEEGGEVQRAKKKETYIGFTDGELQRKIPELIHKCLDEMFVIEIAARKSTEERLAELKKVAPAVTRIIVRSGPGDYYHWRKNDPYTGNRAMWGADRIRGDQAAILAIVLAGIRDNWPDHDLLLFLNQHILMNDDEGLNQLRGKAIQAVHDSGIRLVYSGREDETNAVRRVLGKSHIFIPRDSVDVLSPNGISNTIDQTRQLAEYLKAMHAGEAFIEPSNVQAVRSMRIEKAQEMIPQGVRAYHYAMPTVGGEPSSEYRKGEIWGIVFYMLTQQASFDPASHEII